MSRIGIMGGTFDPIHIGHLMLAEYARQEADLAEIWFIPTGMSYMKASQVTKETGVPTAAERLEMVRFAVEGNPYFCCLDLEVRREGATYTYETLERLHEDYPDHDFFFICGADCLYSIEKWRNVERIFGACTLLAAVRGDAVLAQMKAKCEELEAKFGARVRLLAFRNLELSSTEIRERVTAGKSIRYMVPENVVSYIERKGFYRNDRT